MNKLNINTANVEEISDRVTMIGKERAQAIVDFREARGPIKNLADLKHVSGFSDKLVEGMDIYFVTEEEEEEKPKRKHSSR